jgi:hypothetical protein
VTTTARVGGLQAGSGPRRTGDPRYREVKIALSRRSLGSETEPSRPSRPRSCRSGLRRRRPIPGGVPPSNRRHEHDSDTGDGGEHPSFRRAERTAIRQVIPPEPELSGSPRRGGDAGGRRAGARGLRVTWKSITPTTTADTVRVAPPRTRRSELSRTQYRQIPSEPRASMQARLRESRRSASTSMQVRCIWR